MYYVLDRADAQLEVSILGSYLRAPHHWSDGRVAESDSLFARNAGCERHAADPER